jgi:hypothetical protein
MTTNITPTDDLLSPVKPKFPETGKKLGLKDIVGLQTDYLTKKSDIQKGIAKAGEEEATAKQAQAETLASGKAKAQDEYGTAEKQAMGTFKERTEAEPIPAFVPTKDNAQDLASLFSIINVIGMLVGGGGRTNAVNALAAMDGMAKGYQQGRTDLYRQERDTFDKNYRAMLQKHAEFRKEMEDAIKLAATNKEAGFAAAELAATKAGSSIVKTQIRKGDLTGAYKTVDESQKGAEKALDFVEKEQVRAETEAATERRHKETLASQERLREETMKQARELAAIKAAGTGGGALPKDQKTNDEHRFRFEAMENVNDVLKDLQDPKIARLIGPENQYLPDVVLNLQKDYPQLAQKLARFQSQEFQIGGKSLTTSEQRILGPIYNWRGLTVDALKDNLQEAENAMNRQQMILEARYPGLQEISERYKGTVGGPAPAAAVREFATVEEAEKANLPKGTKIKIGGRSATVE